MLLSEIISLIENFAPPVLQETYDNAGLITGNGSMKISGAMICLDSTEAVIDEAIQNNCNLVIAHHPIVFRGLKKITGSNYVEKTIIKAIKNDIAIYAAHTNLDNVMLGVNAKIGEKLELKNLKVLVPKTGLLKKLVTYCPQQQAGQVREALFSAGSGNIGNYDSCSFNVSGTGTFRANENANPFVGEKGKLHEENEMRIETIFESYREQQVLKALFSSHPYEEIAYDIYSLDNAFNGVGSGMIGEPGEALEEMDFLKLLKTNLKTPMIRHSPYLGKKIKKVAFCGGAGSFLLRDAIKAGADAFVTGDFKYHEFFDAERKLLIADVGHFESEQFTGEIFYDLIKKKFPTFAIRFSETITNPVNYF